MAKKKRYEIEYRDYPGGPVETWRCSAYDREHAEEKFWESCADEGGAEGMSLVSVKRYFTPQEKIERKCNRARRKIKKSK